MTGGACSRSTGRHVGGVAVNGDPLVTSGYASVDQSNQLGSAFLWGEMKGTIETARLIMKWRDYGRVTRGSFTTMYS